MSSKARIIWFCTFILLAAAVWWGMPVYRAKKEHKFAAQAKEAFQEKDFRRALLAARQTLVLNSNNVDACRIMADLADHARASHSIIWRARVAELQPTLENKLALAASAMRYEQPPFAIAAHTLQRLQEEGASSAAFHVTAAQLALRRGQAPLAEQHFSEAIRLEPTNQLHQLNLSVVRLQSTNAAVSQAARQQLESLQSHPQLAENALRSLAAYHQARRDLPAAEAFSARLLNHPRATFGDRMEHLTILHSAKRPEFEPFLNTVQQQAATNAPWAFELGARLLALNEAERALNWLTGLPASTRDQQPVPMAIANAYGAQKDWRGLEKFLADEKWKEQEFVRLALLSHAVRQQNDPKVARAHWDKAVEIASERPESLAVLVQHASEWGWKAEADELLWRVMNRFPKERWAMDALVALYTRDQNTRGLLALYEHTLEGEFATNVVVQNNYAALALLLGTNMTRAHELAERVYRAQPTNPGLVSTYAWSLHIKGKTAEALKIMETLGEAKVSEPAIAGYYGAMLAAAGQKQKAREYLARTDNARLLPEEKQIIADARKQL